MLEFTLPLVPFMSVRIHRKVQWDREDKRPVFAVALHSPNTSARLFALYWNGDTDLPWTDAIVSSMEDAAECYRNTQSRVAGIER